MEAYLERLAAENYSVKTLEGYRYALGRAYRLVGPTAPVRLRSEEAKRLEAGLAHSQHLLRDVSVCLKAMGCSVPIRYTIPPRMRIDWLSLEDCAIVIDAAGRLGTSYSICAHLELQIGFRRASVSRAKVDDFARLPLVYVRGKPTPRRDYTIWSHERTAEIVRMALERRSRMGLGETPWLLPSPGGKTRTARPYSESGLDGIMKRISVESGVRFSNHTLRRSFGRNLWKAGVPIETISEQIGHLSIDQTREYLGINLEDKAEAMKRLAEYES